MALVLKCPAKSPTSSSGYPQTQRVRVLTLARRWVVETDDGKPERRCFDHPSVKDKGGVPTKGRP